MEIYFRATSAGNLCAGTPGCPSHGSEKLLYQRRISSMVMLRQRNLPEMLLTNLVFLHSYLVARDRYPVKLLMRYDKMCTDAPPVILWENCVTDLSVI